MRSGIGEFLAEKAISLAANYDVPTQLLVETFLLFLNKEIDNMVESQFAEPESQSDERVLRQLENILLRYADLQYWHSFVASLEKRGRLGSVPPQLALWITAKGVDPAKSCLEGAETTVKKLYYSEDASGFPAMEEEDWQQLVATLKEQLYSAVLRELLLRAVRTVLDEKEKGRLRWAMQRHEENTR